MLVRGLPRRPEAPHVDGGRREQADRFPLQQRQNSEISLLLQEAECPSEQLFYYPKDIYINNVQGETTIHCCFWTGLADGSFYSTNSILGKQNFVTATFPCLCLGLGR